jgi:hypothetical protein
MARRGKVAISQTKFFMLSSMKCFFTLKLIKKAAQFPEYGTYSREFALKIIWKIQMKQHFSISPARSPHRAFLTASRLGRLQESGRFLKQHGRQSYYQLFRIQPSMITCGRKDSEGTPTKIVVFPAGELDLGLNTIWSLRFRKTLRHGRMVCDGTKTRGNTAQKLHSTTRLRFGT